MELENIILSVVTQSQKNIHGMHSLDISPKAWNTQNIIHRAYEVPREGRPKYGCFSSFKKGNKILTGANMEIQSQEETEAKIIQRLTHLEVQPIYLHQIQTLLWMPRNVS